MPRLLVALILFAAAWLGYSNSLPNGFMLDDHTYFNSTMKNLKFVPFHFLPGKGSVLGLERKNNKGYYRPLTRSVYTVLYVAFGTNPVPYHIANIVFLGTAGFLIYILIQAFFPAAGLTALWAALFFVIHPLNSTFVNFIGAGIYLAQTGLMLLCVWQVAQAKRFSYVWAIVFMLLAAFCHESALSTILYAAILLFALRRPLVTNLWPLALATMLYLIFILSRTSLVENLLYYSPIHGQLSIGDYLSSLGRVVFWYLGCLLSPSKIVFMWGTPIATSLFWIGVLIVLVAGAFLAVVWCWKKGHTIMFLGIAWMIAAFVPAIAGGIGRPGIICIEPHWMIFALIGFCLCLADLVARVPNRLLAWTLCALIIVPWAYLDRQYNELWGNEKVYCYYWHDVFPTSQVPFYYMAGAYLEEKDLIEAGRLFTESFKNPSVAKNYNWDVLMGGIMVQQQRWAEAKVLLEEALSMQAENPQVLTHLGVVAFAQKDIKKAKEYFIRAVLDDKFEIVGRLNLASIARREGQLAMAIRMHQEILALEPRNEISLVDLIQIYLEQGDKENILKIARQLKESSQNPQVLKNVAWILLKYDP